MGAGELRCLGHWQRVSEPGLWLRVWLGLFGTWLPLRRLRLLRIRLVLLPLRTRQHRQRSWQRSRHDWVATTITPAPALTRARDGAVLRRLSFLLRATPPTKLPHRMSLLLMLWTAPPLHVSAMEVGTIILLEICAAHKSLRGPFRPIASQLYSGRYWRPNRHWAILKREASIACDPTETWGAALAPYSAAAGCASVHSSGFSSSLRSGKKSAQPSVTTEKRASTVVTAATLPVRSYNVDTSGAAAAEPRKPTKKRTE